MISSADGADLSASGRNGAGAGIAGRAFRYAGDYTARIICLALGAANFMVIAIYAAKKFEFLTALLAFVFVDRHYF